jgi:predicted anti-sigma-YlaC factor YlaD
VIDHEAADELLAGYVLGSLTGPDAEEADRLLTEHVPDCLTCRATLDAFQGVTGELGLVADPLAPPETLLPRMERELTGGRRRSGLPSWSPARVVAGAAAAVVLIGVVGLSLLNDGGDPSQLLTKADLAQVNQLKAQPETSVAPITSTVADAEEVEPSDHSELYVMGTFEAAGPGFTYRLYAVGDGSTSYIGDLNPPTGLVAFRVAVDPATVDELILQIEPVASPPSEPVTASAQPAA